MKKRTYQYNIGKESFWINTNNDQEYQCALCKSKVKIIHVGFAQKYRYNFCPRCGALMLGYITYCKDIDETIRKLRDNSFIKKERI